MRPCDIVKQSIQFKHPPRLPVRFPSLGVDDTARLLGSADYLSADYTPNFKPLAENADEWGCIWEKTDVANLGQVKQHPLKLISQLDSYPVPDYNDDTRYRNLLSVLDEYEDQGRYVLVDIFMVLFERMHTLYGLENVLCELILDRPAMEALADRIVEVHLQFIDNIQRRFGNRIHAFRVSDDWGTQQASFISFDLWMDFFFPRYKRLYDAMHKAGYDVWVHSCGKINEIIEGFIKAGVNVVNIQQPRALGIEEIGNHFRGRITFDSLADIQHTLPTGDRSKVDEDVHMLMEHWASPDGGLILGDYGDDIAIGISDPDIKLYMYECFSKYSKKIYGEPLPEHQNS